MATAQQTDNGKPSINQSGEAPRKRLKRKKSDAVRYHCNYCGKDISNVVRIKCAVCQDFDLCVQCFAVGVEITPHKNFHDYHVMDALNFPLFDEEWGADEELLLLEGIEMYGLGNWGDVADHVGTKEPEQCKVHYFSTYIDISTAPLPDMTKVLTTSETLHQRNMNRSLENEEEPEEEEPEEKIEKKEESRSQTSSKSFIPTGHTSIGYSYPDMAGYMPLRGDFETEFENDAEAGICDMIFNDDDTPQDIELKVKMLDIYNKRLDERIKRKRFLQERGIVDPKRKERKRPKEEKEVYDRLRIYARVLTKEEHEDFVNGVIAEKQLKRKIEELKRFRKMGIRSMTEVQEFEEERKKREGEQTRRAREGSTYGFPSAERLRMSRTVSREKFEKSIKLKPRKQGAPLEIEGAAGYELLTEREKELCSSLRLYPQQYMIIKDTLLQESLRQGSLKKAMARQLIKIDVNKTSRIFDFLETSGWINKGVASPSEDIATLPPIYVPPNSNVPSFSSPSSQMGVTTSS